MKKKRIIISMLTLLCCCTGAWADEVDNDTHLKYTVANDEVTITGFADDFTPGANYALVIPDVIDGKPVVAVGASAFIDKTNFTTLTIGKNVKTIGTDAFRRTKSMTSVTFAPDGVLETLGESAFRGCDELTEFVMPNTVATIGKYVLQANAKLASVILSNQLTTLSTQALCNCPMLKTVNIPESITKIESGAFRNDNGGLEEITIPSTVTSVSSDAFNGCSNLKTVIWNSATVPENIFKDKTSLQTVTFGEGVTTIKNNAFQGCTGLTELTIPATLTKIETFAFTGCTNVTTVTTQDGTLAKTGDYYELSTLAHWRLFSVLVLANNTANAKMTADIDLGNDQTMIGFYNGYPWDSYSYQGTFDGQDHTLTIYYVTTKNHYTAPFQYIENATIKNLHVTGTINATHGGVGGFVGYTSSGSIINCRSSIALTSSFTGSAGYGGFVAGGSPNIKDSYFDGSFNAPNACSCGGFVGGNMSKTKIDNCLFNPQSFVVGVDETYSYSGPFTTWDGSNQSVTPTNSYFTFHVNTSQQGTRAYTSENVPEGAPTTEVTAADGNKYYVITRITGLTDDKDFEYGQAGYYFVNLNKTGTKTLTLTADDVQELEKASASTIKIYDDQGKTGASMCGNSTLVLNAPEGYQLQLTGYVNTYNADFEDNFKVYDGSSTSATLLYEKGSGFEKVNIGTFTSTGRSLTINFTGIHEGLNLTATLIKASSVYTVNVNNPATGGSVAASPASAAINTVVTLTATPPDGCIVNSISITGNMDNWVGVTGGHWYDYYDANQATFTMPGSDVTVTPTFINPLTEANKISINMPHRGTNSIAIPSTIRSFKVYDDGGPNKNYSINGEGILILTAPEGCVLQLTGNVYIHNGNYDDCFYIYDGDGASEETKIGQFTGQVDVGTITSSGRSMTLRLVSDYYNTKSGLNLTATLVPSVQIADNSDDLSALEAYAGRTCTVTYSRSFTEAKSSTVCLPFAFAKGSVGTFYTFTGISKNESGEYIATMTEYTGDNLVANTPYLFTPSTTGSVDFGGTYTLPASITAGSTTSGDWTYLGTYKTISWTEAPTGIYGFSAQAVEEQGISQGQFVKVGAYVRIKPMRCYLKYKSGSANYAGARGMNRAADEELPETIKVRLIGADGEVTAIGSLQTKTGEVTFDKDAWYSLDGRRIEGKPTVKGIYVNNGKKVIIK